MSGFPLNVPNLLEPEPEPEKERNNDCFNCVQKPNKNKVHPNPSPDIPNLNDGENKKKFICCC